jgi:hypothetical protein
MVNPSLVLITGDLTGMLQLLPCSSLDVLAELV